MTAGFLTFILTLIAFGAIDAAWLKAMAQRTYAAEIGALLRDKPRVIPALLFYVMFAAGLAFFAVIPGIASKSPLAAIVSGGLLGLVAYGTYNLTNLAVIRGYSTRIATIDLLWGVIASASTAGLVTWIGLRLMT
ncbi:MAG: DUF2177 family protein [Alphaproteobacteria bacterium]|nr:DUF2177 family protein [Alphaproteobacteria bacterium]